jgi:acyl-CoA thioester hydrolase
MSDASEARASAWAYRHRLSVRFRDCDAMGHVNHAVYFTYMEQCRLTFWREATGTASPHTRVIIARAECDYRAPAHFGDELEVRLQVGAIGRSSFALEYEIVQVGADTLVATGKTVMVSYDYAAGKSVPLPMRRSHYEHVWGQTPVRTGV